VPHKAPVETPASVKTPTPVETSATTSAGFRGARPGRAGEGDRHDGNCHRQFVGHATLHFNHDVRFHLRQTVMYACPKLTTMR
jgi:hypothetical protein